MAERVAATFVQEGQKLLAGHDLGGGEPRPHSTLVREGGSHSVWLRADVYYFLGPLFLLVSLGNFLSRHPLPSPRGRASHEG